MALQYSVAVRNAQLDVFEATVGASAVLKIRAGAIPVDCAAADVGTVLATINLPPDWMAAASSGVKLKNGVWATTYADASGTASYFRIYASDGVTVHAQGAISLSGGDMTLNNVLIASGQVVTVTAFTISANNA